jgi:hypothetical protein
MRQGRWIPDRRQPCPRTRRLAGDDRLERMVAATRPEPDVAGPAAATGRGGFSRRKTQYKCGNSRVWNNYPLGKPRYDQRLLLAPAPWLRWSEMAAETGLSNGAQNACSFHCRWIHDAGRPRDGTAAAGSVPNRGPEGMTRTCKNGVMRRAGTTGAEAG